MKKLFLLLVVFFASVSMEMGHIAAQETLVGTEFTVNLNNVDVIFTITGDGDTKTVKVGCQNGDYSHTAVDHEITQTSITIPATVEYNGTAYTVTAIGECAFQQIGKLQEVVMPSSIETIEDYAFLYGDNLTTIEIPASVTSIGYHAFLGCRKLVNFTVSKDNNKYDSRDNCNAVIETVTNKLVVGVHSTVIPASVTTIGENAFCNNSELKLTIPTTVTAIENGAFSWCSRSVFTIESSIPLEIDENAFYGVKPDDLSRYCFLRVPEGTKDAYLNATGWNKFPPEYVLEGDDGLEFSEDVTTEGSTVSMLFTITDRNAKTVKVGQMFGNTEETAVGKGIAATSIAVPEKITHAGIDYTVTAIGDFAFSDCYSLIQISLPNSISSIGKHAFAGCYGLTALEIPANVTTIGERIIQSFSISSLTVAEGNKVFEAPEGCNAIVEKATNKLIIGTIATKFIPSSVIEIGENAFWNVNQLILTIPKTVRKIGSEAFGACHNSVFSVGYSADELTEIDVAEDAFNYSSQSTLRVPAGTKDSYLAATGWSYFSPENVYEGNWGIEFTEPVAIDGGSTVDMTFTVTSDGEEKTVKVGHLTGYQNCLATNVENDKTGLSIAIPETVTYESIVYTVTAIGDYAFGNTSFKNIYLPNTIKTIGRYAFSACWNLTTFEIPSSVTYIDKECFSSNQLISLTVAEGNEYYEAPNGCNAIIEKASNKLICGTKGTTIPERVTAIGDMAFYNIQGLEISIPTTVRKIGNQAFAQCYNSIITANYLADELSEVDLDVFAFYHDNPSPVPVYLRVPAGTKAAYLATTGWNVFSSESVMEGNEGTEFTEDVTNSYGTISMTFTVTNDNEEKTVKLGYLIGDYKNTGINRNMAVQTVAVPEKVTHDGVEYSVTCIGKYAIYDCSNVRNIEIPASITAIEEFGITNCWNLETIKVDDNNVYYESPEGCNAVIEKATHKLVVGSKGTITIPASVIEIGERAFSCGEMSVTIPTSIRKINNNAFTSGSVFIRVNYDVDELQEIEVAEYAFNKNCTLLVPSGTKAAYMEATGWKTINTIAEEQVIHVAMAGTLTDLISEGEKYGIVELKLTGELNGTDFRLLRDMAGYNYKGENTKGILKNLDLSGARIVAGGEMYIDATRLKSGKNEYVVGTFQYNIETPDVFPERAFQGCNLETISLPHVTEIGSFSLGCCLYLKKVIISSSVSVINNLPFSNSLGLMEIEVDAENENYTSEDGVLFNHDKTELICYPLGKSSMSYTVPTTVKYLKERAFYGNSSLNSIVLPEGLISIGYYAFNKCQSLTSMTIPSSVNSLHASAFEGCANMAQIQVSPDNMKYASENGVLFNKDKTEIICYPRGKKSTSYSIPNGVMTISDQAFLDCTMLSTVEIPITVKAIGFSAFWGCTSLESLVIPGTVKSINSYAFYDCKALSSITSENAIPFDIEENVFEGTKSSNPQQNVDIYSTATLYVPIGTSERYRSKAGWSKFKNIEEKEIEIVTRRTINVETAGTLPTLISGDKKYVIEELTLTGNLNGTDFRLLRDMAGCNYLGLQTEGNLHVLDISNANIVAGGDLFIDAESVHGAGAVYLGAVRKQIESDNVIPSYLFAGCRISEVVLPNTITEIQRDAFMFCDNITSMVIPKGVNTFHYEALRLKNLKNVSVDPLNPVFDSRDNCNAIIENATNTMVFGCKNTTIPTSVTTIGHNAFTWCENLESITIPQTISLIYGDAFTHCSNLGTIVVEKGNSKYDSRDNCNAIIETATNTLVVGCKNSIIPESVKVIGEYAFEGCYMEAITIPSGVTEISDHAFYNCISLTSIVIPEGVTKIGYEAFGSCALITVILPSSLTTIGNRAFFENRKLTSVISSIVNPFEIQTNVFSNEAYCNAKLMVPYGKKSAYQSAGGWNFAVIEEMALTPMDDQEEVGFDEMNENTNLSGTIIDNVFFNITSGNGGYDATDNSVVVSKPMTDEEIAAVFGNDQKDLFSDEVKNNFAGMVVEVPAGKGVVTVEAQTTGGLTLKVKIGNADPVEVEFEGKLKLKFPYDVTEPTYAYIFAGETQASVRARTRGENPCLRIYGISVNRNVISGDANGDGVVNYSDVVAVLDRIIGGTSGKFVEAAADVNNDGQITIADALGIVEIINQ